MAKVNKRLIVWFRKLGKYSVVGGGVTVISLSLNFVFLKYLETPLIPTYVTIYLFTIMISYLLNSKFTFKIGWSFKNMLRYYTIYLSGIVIGVVLLSIFKYFIPAENWVYPFMVIPFTTIWNFTIANKKLRSTG